MNNINMFNTFNDYWQALESLTYPNVSYIKDQDKCYYMKIKPGVYILSDKELYLPEEWSKSNFYAEAIVLIDPICKFMIAKEDLGVGVWSTNTEYIPGVSISSLGFDYNGVKNTDIIIKHDKELAEAANLCRNYTFPNGEKGYLGSEGEWMKISYYRYLILDAMNTVGSTYFLDGSSYWTSTLDTPINAKRCHMPNYSIDSASKTNNARARAFGIFNW